ncbi:MAG: hypothetical protein IJF40_05665 [Clostridia bacterium]|nr:hypothetical protein [Clostridia bacterium]
MKRLLYIAFNNFSNLHFGPTAKVLSQCRAFESHGYDVELIGRMGTQTVIIEGAEKYSEISSHKALINHTRARNLIDKHNQINDIKKYIKNKSYDACYIRYDFSDSDFIGLLKDIKKVCPKIGLELPTYPYDDENKYGLMSKTRLAVDKIYRKQLHKYVDFIVTFYGGHDKIFGVPVTVIPNGFDFSRMNLVESELPSDGVHIIAVSAMREWHGYERIIEGMNNYYKDGEADKQNFILHLVGDGREYGKYKGLVEQYRLEKHVIMEGAMYGEALDALYEKCALGIDSLARHRSGIDVLSSLKSREYGAKGIPMINSCKIDIIEDDFNYLLRVPADETPVDMNSVESFYNACYGAGKSRLEIGEEIRSYIKQRSGMKETLVKVVERF